MSKERIARLERRLVREKSARVEAEEIAEAGLRDLYLANQELDQRIEVRTAELVDARGAAEHAAAARSEFLGSLSRQVRTPLNGVTGMLDLLSSRATDNQTQAWIDSAKASSDDLLRLFSRLVLFVELEEPNRALARTEHAVAEVLKSIDARWARRAMPYGKLLFVVDETPSGSTACSVHERLDQLLDEIIDNAVRHADPGPIYVRASALGDDLLIRVEDSGPGLADADNTLGARHPAPGPVTTLGMGRTLMQRLCGRLDAGLMQCSDPGSGTTIEVRLRGQLGTQHL